MKKFLLLLACALFLFSCAMGGGGYGAPPIPPTLCEEFAADKPNSLLLKIQAQYNVPINEVYYGLIDTSRIMMITDLVDKAWIKDYLDKVAVYYNANYPNLTHDQLVTYMVSQKVWGEKVELALSILSSRIGYFRSTFLIGPYDNCMYVHGWTKAKQLLFIAKSEKKLFKEEV